jgi:hypothetical protein
MIYVFDTNSFSNLNHYYPDVFVSLWTGLDDLYNTKQLISTREAWNELKNGNPDQHINKWLKSRKELFLTPTAAEMQFVAEILSIKHFHTLIGKKQILDGKPVADPFLIACAKICGGTLVTEEQFKQNASKIPNVCHHFGIPCINLNEFMQQQGWSF